MIFLSMSLQNCHKMSRNLRSNTKNSLPKKLELDVSASKWLSKPSRKIFASSKKRNNFIDSIKSDKSTKKCIAKSDLVMNITTKSSKYLSPSAKLDRNVPKAADILRAREEAKKLNEIDKIIKKSSVKFLEELEDNDYYGEMLEKPKFTDINCRHLTPYQINTKFCRDVSYLDGIFQGKIYSERHEIFQKKYVYKNDFTEKQFKIDLRVSESLGAFTSDQLIYIISLFRERYDNGNRYKYSDYYFKVLLPEYCLKIFMDCHQMSQSEAAEYLKNLPITDYLGLQA